MQTRNFRTFGWVLAALWFGGFAAGADFQFRHHFIDRTLPATDSLVGDYGLTALVDLEGDGDLDFVLGGRPFAPSQLYWFEFQTPDRWARHLVGTNYLSDVGLAALDVDRDGWLDVVCSGVWYRNSGKPREHVFERIVFDENAAGAHDVLIADIDGDGKQEIVVADTDILDSKVAVLENADGRGGRWTRTDLAQSFTYGSLHSLAMADFSGDGKPDIVVNEQEELLPPGRENPRWIIWENLGGDRFVERIVLDTKLGGHELQVGDVNGDGDIDICSKPWGPLPWNGNDGKLHVDFLENLLKP